MQFDAKTKTCLHAFETRFKRKPSAYEHSAIVTYVECGLGPKAIVDIFDVIEAEYAVIG